MEKKEIELLVDERVKQNYSLSIKYWYPTIISVFIFAFGIVWWFYNTISPLEKELYKIKNEKMANDLNAKSIAKYYYYLHNVSLKKLNKKNLTKIEDAISQLKERKDLVVIIGGYTNKDENQNLDKKKNITELAAKNIYDLMVAKGISKDRLFYRGYGYMVPDWFEKKGDINICVLLCDVYEIMKTVAA